MDKMVALVKISQGGRIPLTKDLCKEFDVRVGDKILILRNEENRIIIQKAEV